jgi:hypothetical protein
MAVRKQESVKDTEARLRGLIRETASLREELRKESKRKENALARAKDQECIAKDVEKNFLEARYTQRYV